MVYSTFKLGFWPVLVLLHLLSIQIIEVQPMSFKVIVNVLNDADDSGNTRDTFNPLLRTSATGWHRPLLQGYVAAIRKGEYSWARLGILSKTLPRTAANARANGDVWTAHWADQVMAAIEVHGHKVGWPRTKTDK
jgi:hypothetical protein